jgi:hypothetical protein
MSDRVRLRLQLPAAARLYPSTETRYLFCERLLNERSYDRVLLSDTRDVLFQSDPFSALPVEGLAVSIESRTYTLATESHNAGWIVQGFGTVMLERIGHNAIACSGVTYGDGDNIGKYLELMVRGILRRKLGALGWGGMDQAIHNVLLWTGQLGDVTEMETLDSPVATFGGVAADQLHVGDDDRLLNRDGTIISILHQYDRLPDASEVAMRWLVRQRATA